MSKSGIRERVVIDTDAGIDDAMALFLALRSPELEIVGITSVFGNSTVMDTTRNVLAVLRTAGRLDIPVSVGAHCSLAEEKEPRGALFHGRDGLAGCSEKFYPDPLQLTGKTAAQYIHDTVMADPGQVSLVALGPLTNIALALRLWPDLKGKIKRIVALGGALGIPGNATPVAEANLYDDPLAAWIVLGAGIDTTLIGLNCTTQVVMTPQYVRQLGSVDSPETRFIQAVIGYYQQAYAHIHGMGGAVYCHDATLIGYLVKPEIFSTETVPVWVELAGRNQGMLVADRKKQWADSQLAHIGVGIDAAAMLDLYLERMTR